MPRSPRIVVAGLAAALCLSTLVAPAQAVRMMNYNLLNWGGSSGASRVSYMRAVVRGIGPDLVVSQEVTDQAGVDLFRDQVLNFREPGQWVAAPFTNGPDTDNSLWYKPAKFTLVDVVLIPTALRNVARYHLRLAGYTSAEAELYVYSFHLKASSGSTNEQLRLAEMQIIRGDAETLPIGSHIVFCGDYNVYRDTEPAFQYALSSIGSNIGRMKDPINQLGAWQDNAAFAPYHTQSPRTLSFGGGSTGGMDDRFDFILESYNLDDGQGLDLLESTYKAYGNDGYHLNRAINAEATIDPVGTGPANYAVGILMADSLMNASDHLPVTTEFAVPAKIQVAPAAIAFGTVIQGAVASLPLTVRNVADVPGDVLDATLDLPAGFTGSGDPFTVAAGTAVDQPLGMDTATPGVKAAQLGIFSDDPDNGYLLVDLSGTVLAHAVPSTDSLSVVATGALDFGEQQAGGFADRKALVYNTGWNALQARLHVTGATITGGNGHFALVEPFAPALLQLEPAAYDVRFDDTGATTDSTYEATLTFACEDESGIPGATARPAVAYQLTARVAGAAVAVGDGRDAVPTVTVLFAPRPNPAPAGRTTLRFDLAHAARVQLAIYDVSGRRVATVADDERAAGAHSVTWNGRDAAGRAVAGGVYFVHMTSTDGVTASKRFVVLR